MDIKWLAPRSVFYSLYYDGSLLDYGPSSRGENLKCHAQTSSTRRLLWRMLTISDGLAPLESVYPTYEYLNLTKENQRLENQKFTRISLRTNIDEQIQKIYIKIIKFQNSSSERNNTCLLFFHNLEWPRCFRIINSFFSPRLLLIFLLRFLDINPPSTIAQTNTCVSIAVKDKKAERKWK